MKNITFPYQVVLFGFDAVNGTNQTRLAQAQTLEGCIAQFTKFITTQPLHHFGITNKSVIKMWNVEIGFMFDLPMIDTVIA